MHNMLLQLHVLNEKFKNKQSGLYNWIFIGHFCGVKHWDLPFSVWISELEKELFSAHPVTLEEELIFGMSSHHELSAAQQLRTFN